MVGTGAAADTRLIHTCAVTRHHTTITQTTSSRRISTQALIRIRISTLQDRIVDMGVAEVEVVAVVVVVGTTEEEEEVVEEASVRRIPAAAVEAEAEVAVKEVVLVDIPPRREPHRPRRLPPPRRGAVEVGRRRGREEVVASLRM